MRLADIFLTHEDNKETDDKPVEDGENVFRLG